MANNFEMDFVPGAEVDSDLLASTCSYVDEMMNIAATADATPTPWLMTSNSTVTSAAADDYDPNGGYCLGYLDTTTPPHIDSETSDSSTSANSKFGRASSTSTNDEGSPSFIKPTSYYTELDDLRGFFEGKADDLFQAESGDAELKPLVTTDIYKLAYDECLSDPDQAFTNQDLTEVTTGKAAKRKYRKRVVKKDDDKSAEAQAAATIKRRRPKRVRFADSKLNNADIRDDIKAESKIKIIKAAETLRSPKKIPSRAKPKLVPDEEKDLAYWAHRRKNTLAAKRSRAKKRCLESDQDTFEEMMSARGLDDKSKVLFRRFRSEMGTMIFDAFKAGKGEIEKQGDDEQDK